MMTTKNRFYFLVLLFVLAPASGNCGLLIGSHNDTTSYTPFMEAASNCDLGTVRSELEKDSTQINAKDTDMDNETALHEAVNRDCTEVTQYLLDNGADASAVKTDGITPLHLAARNGNIEIIRSLIKAKAKINALDANGWTPLDRAEKRGHQDAVEVLKQLGGREGASEP